MSEPQTIHFDDPPVITAAAAWNGLAFGPYQTWAFRRAELTPFAASRFRCANGERALMAHIRSLPPQDLGVTRLVAIGDRLLKSLRPVLDALPPGARVALGLCLPERMVKPGGQRAFLIQRAQLERTLRGLIPGGRSKTALFTYARGHAGLAFALGELGAAVAQGGLDVAVVGAVDTYHDPEVVQALIDEERLFDGEHPDRLVPGEGGAFFTLTTAAFAAAQGWPQLGHVEAVATNQEPATVRNEIPCLGLGLSRAALAATEELRARKQPLDWWMSDATGEPHRLHEFQLAWPRASAGVMTEQSTLDFLPVHLGDLGAAAMPTAVAIATQGFLRGGPAARTCLVTGSSDGEDRGVVLLGRPAAHELA